MEPRARKDFPTLNSEILRDYLGAGDRAAHTKASRSLFEHYGPRIQATVHERLRRRYGELSGEVVQEAWLRCLDELRARKDELMQSRPKRPSVGLLMASHTMRAVWALEQRTRRLHARHTTITDAQPEAALNRVADTDITPADFHAIFEAAWTELLQVSTPAEREALVEAGPVLFFAGDWRSSTDATDAHAEIITQRVIAVREILQRILSDRYALEPKAIRRFLRWLLP